MSRSASSFQWGKLYLVPLLLLPFSLCALILMVMISQADRVQPEFIVRSLQRIVPTAEGNLADILATLQPLTVDPIIMDDDISPGVSANTANCVFANVGKFYGTDRSFDIVIGEITNALGALGWTHFCGRCTSESSHDYYSEQAYMSIGHIDPYWPGVSLDFPETPHFNTIYQVFLLTTVPFRCAP